jgi:hypothetical protein
MAVLRSLNSIKKETAVERSSSLPFNNWNRVLNICYFFQAIGAQKGVGSFVSANLVNTLRLDFGIGGRTPDQRPGIQFSVIAI